MRLDKLFQVLVVGGAMLGASAAGCGPDKAPEPSESNNSGSNSSTSSDGGTTDGGTGGDPDNCGVCCWLGG